MPDGLFSCAMLKEIGHVTGVWGAVYFSAIPGVKNTEVAFASLAKTDIGLLFVHEVDNILLNIFDPLYVHYWFEYLLLTRTRITAEILFANDIVDLLTKTRTRTPKDQRLPLVTVGYPEEQQQFFSTFDKSWTPMPVTAPLVEEHLLRYQTSRTKNFHAEPRLQFSQASQFQKVSTNLLTQVAIGMALQLCESAGEQYVYAAKSSKFIVKDEEQPEGFWSVRFEKKRNPYILAR